MTYYDGTGARRLQQIKHTDPTNAVISQFDYTYNAAGNILTWTQNHSGLTNPRRYTFGYDGIDQLISASLRDTVTNGNLKEQAYRYDAAGNRTTVQDGNTVATETSNILNQIKSVSGGGMMRFAGTVNEPAKVTVGGNPVVVRGDNTFEGYAQVAPTGTTRVPIEATDVDNNVTSKYVDVTPDAVSAKEFTYDLNGNTVTVGPSGAPDATYGWDAADRLVSVTQGADITTFEYDGLGRRVKERLNGAETRRWVWVGLELCEERDNSNNVANRFCGQGEQIGSDSYFFTRDHLGSVRELTDSNNGLRARYEYELNGKRSVNLVSVNAIEGDIGFTGHQELPSLGIVAAPLRFYSTSLARWLSRDPIGETGGLNLYGYVRNNSINLIDLFGLDWIKVYNVTGGRAADYYGGKPGDETDVKQSYGSVSSGKNGITDQRVPNEGPTPAGKYLIDLSPDPNRIAPNDGNSLIASKGGGIERVPYPFSLLWGSDRALLESLSGTDTYGRSTMYLHNSTNGVTSGCTEIPNPPRLQGVSIFERMRQYRASGARQIQVWIYY